MNKYYRSIIFITYLIISSFFVNIERQNLILHVINIIPILFIIYLYIKKPFPQTIEAYLVLIPQIFFILNEIIIYIFAESSKEPFIFYIHGFYFFATHCCFIFIYRIEGGDIITFSKKDYFQIFPIILATFLIFGFVFLPIVPGKFLLLTMIIASLLAILLSHIINRHVKGKSYILSFAGGILIATTDFLLGYNTFIENDPIFYTISRFMYFLGLYFLVESLISIKYSKTKPSKITYYDT